MGMATYMETIMLNSTLKGAAFTTIPTVYVALYTSDPTAADTGVEVAGNAYARQALTNGFSVPASGVSSNSSIISFPVATGAWGTVGWFGIRTALTAGSLIYSGPLTTPQAVVLNTQLQFLIGQLSVTLA